MRCMTFYRVVVDYCPPGVLIAGVTFVGLPFQRRPFEAFNR